MADKKISQLPKINALSGSNGGEIIVPLVHDGTTQKMEIGAFAKYISQHSAQTGSANTFYGTQTFTGNVNVNGRLTVHEIYANYETASIIFSSGSNIFGDQASDVHTFVGTINLNGLALGTSELMAQTASQAAVNTNINLTTASIHTTTASLNFSTGALNAFTGSVIGQTNTIATFTSSINFATQSLNTQTGSQDLVNMGISSVTGSINTTTSSFDSVFQRISSTTGSINTTTSSFDSVFLRISSTTGSINTTTSSFDSVFLGISSVTGSLIGITNTLMAFTAALDNTYATDAQLYQLYQATSSIHSATQSLNIQTGSQDLVNMGISSVTGSINTTTSSFNSEFVKIGSTTASIHSATASLNTQTGSQSNLNAQIGIATSSLNTFSGSIRGEVSGLEAYTASLKAAAIVSSSTQITNYYKFAETASANTFYGNQTIQGNLQLSATSPLVYNAGNTNAMLFGFFDGSSIYGPYYQIFGSNYSNTTQRGSAEFVFDSRNGGYSGFNIAEFNGSTWLRKFRVSQNGAEVTGSFVVDGGITGSLMATNNVVSSSTQVVNYNLFALTASANTFYGTQSVTGSVRISGSIDDISYIDFDTVAPATGIARLGWDAGEGTLTIGLSGGNVNIPIGVTSFETAYNEDSSSISKGDVVRVSGAQGNRVAVKKANNLDDGGSATTVALAAETIGVGAEGKVILSGPLKGIDTTAFGEGDLLYLSSTPGGITNIKPQAPFHEVRIGVAQRISATVGIVNVKVDNGYELDELHNVRITTASLAFNQLVAYSGSVWRNETISGLGIAITGSNTFIGIETISGSLLVSGSTLQTGNNTLIGNTVLSGSIIVSGSSDFKNSSFIVTGSSHFTGSHFVDGVSTFSGSIYIASGSSYYRAGNKLFNYGQWCSLETQTGSANTAYAMKFGTKLDGSEGVYVSNNLSNFPTRVYLENTGMYNIQFSAQLHTTTAAQTDFSVWLSKDGTNITNSNTEYSIEIVAGGGYLAATRNFLEPITSGSYVELFWSATTSTGQLLYKAAQSTPTRPATPSCIVTITQVA